jgi:hypothetical protein
VARRSYLFVKTHLLFLSALGLFLTSARGDVTVTEKPGVVRVELNGELFTEYHYGDAAHVYYWPVLGPGGVKMTRSYPMEKVAGEETDHIHQRSMWFSHGEVNGIDFWGEEASYKGTPKIPVGKIEHVKIVKAESGKDAGVLTTEAKWTAPDGAVVVRSLQTLRLYSGEAKERVCDFEVTLTAGEKDVTFGDTKEGTAGLRIAESMRLKQPKGPGKGSIVNSEGEEGAKVWGRHAKWVAMTGPIGEKTYSITFMDHPSNLRYPTRWHARDYGLFAANPFCEAEMDPSQPKHSGNYVLKAGEKLTFKYRLAFTEGDAASAQSAERWKKFSETK